MLTNATTDEGKLPDKAIPLARGMALEGGEAVKLYAPEIARKIRMLNRQMELLQAALTEHGELLREGE